MANLGPAEKQRRILQLEVDSQKLQSRIQQAEAKQKKKTQKTKNRIIKGLLNI